MFQKEEESIGRAERLLATSLAGTLAEEPFEELLEVARKLLRQSRRLVTMGDRMQAQLGALNEKLACMARTDALTGLDNRGHFMDQARREFSRSRRTGAPLSLLLLDADHFKSVNDTWGHDVGDRVLREIAEVLRTSIRDHDVAARIGGEEFVVLLPETDCRGAALIAERVRAAVEQRLLKVEERAVQVTLSIGCTSVGSWKHDVAVDALLKRADVALYAAKKNGRNRVEQYAGMQCGGLCPSSLSGISPQ